MTKDIFLFNMTNKEMKLNYEYIKDIIELNFLEEIIYQKII